jgi:hypothetical protein
VEHDRIPRFDRLDTQVNTKTGMTSMPAYEAEIRWQVLGEKVARYQQLELAFPATNHYAYERRGW